MSADLERRYARLLGAYPAGYRHEHQQEILATLLDSADPGQRHPSAREAAALVVGGLRTRARLAARQSPWSPWSLWAEGLWLGVLLLLASVVAAAAVYVAPRLLGYLATTLLDGANGMGVWDVVVPLAIAAVVALLLATGGTRARRLSTGDGP